MKKDPQNRHNQHLLRAKESNVPVINFLGFTPSKYQVIMSVRIVDWVATELKEEITIAVVDHKPIEVVEIER